MKQWSTASIPAQEQFEYWREVICQSFVTLRPERIATPQGDPRFQCSLSTWETQDLFFGCVSGQGQWVYRESSEISSTDRPVYFLNIQSKGQARIQQNGFETILEPNSFSLVDATLPFRMQVSEGFEQLSIKIPKSRLYDLIEYPDSIASRRVATHRGLGRLVIRALEALAEESQYLHQRGGAIAVEHALALVACSLNHPQTLDDRLIEHRSNLSLKKGKFTRLTGILKQAQSFIEARLEDPQLNAKQVSDSLGFSTRYIQAAFSAHQTSVGNWILDERLKLCHKVLVNAPSSRAETIAEIAFKYGFNDLSYFNRTFKRKYGVTPSQARCGSN